jgi:hypothetical protein
MGKNGVAIKNNGDAKIAGKNQPKKKKGFFCCG